MFHLTLRQRFMVGPLFGLIIIIALTASFLLQSEKQNDLIQEITEKDLTTLGIYAELFTNLSRNHQALYDLVNSAGKDVDEAELYDQGVAIIDHIFDVSREMEESIQATSNETSNILATNSESILKVIMQYQNAVISAVENTTVSPELAPIYLSHANSSYSVLHEHLAFELDNARARIASKAAQHIEQIQHQTSSLILISIISTFILLISSFVTAGILSKKIREYIKQLYSLSENSLTGEGLGNNRTYEIDLLDRAIMAFKQSLQINKENENKLFETNQKLQTQIEIKQVQEALLQEAKQDLEKRVADRTINLTQLNKVLEREIEQRTHAEQNLRIYKEIILNTDEAILVTKPDGTIIEVNPAYLRNTGYSREELIGQNPRILQAGTHDKIFYKKMWESINEQGHWSGEIWDRKKNGEIFPLWIMINAIRDANDEVQYLIGLYRDISELKQAEARLEQLAFYDPLTTLPNRTLFNEKLCQELSSSKRHQEKMALLFLDLDNFKDINDSLGHSMGDKLLIEVGRRLNATLRDSDIIARLGGDEFNIAVTQLSDITYVKKIARNIIKAISDPYLINNHTLRVGVSIGISIYPDHSDNIETLKKYSDMAMYKAKSMGKNQFQIFTPELKHNREHKFNLDAALSKSLEKNEFELYYQPIIDLRDNRTVSAEALIRWQHDGQPIPPDEFIPFAEESDFIKQIDLWVLENACQNAMEWNTLLTEPIGVNINLSAKFFQQRDTPEIISHTIDNLGMDGRLLCLEITETAVITDSSATKKNIEEIKKLGVQIALDDFGTGFSSLNYLTQFSMDKIKIDRSFICNLHNDTSSQAVVDALIKLANKLGITVVSEGVESLRHHLFLQRAGCHFSQGYYYSRPLTRTRFIDWITNYKNATGEPFEANPASSR